VTTGACRGTWGRFHITLFSITGGCPTKHGYLHWIRLVSGGRIIASHSFIHWSMRLNQPMPSSWKVPFHFFIALDSGPHPPGLKIWKSCLFAMFLLGIFIGVLLCVVGLRLFQCHHFWIIDSGWLTNHSTWSGRTPGLSLESVEPPPRRRGFLYHWFSRVSA
jgi:hypothetical protein